MTQVDKEHWKAILDGTNIKIDDVKTIIAVPYGYWVVTDEDPEIWVAERRAADTAAHLAKLRDFARRLKAAGEKRSELSQTREFQARTKRSE